MPFRSLVALCLIAGAVTSDVLGSVEALCRPSRDGTMGNATCCCGPHACPAKDIPGASLKPSCCEMRQNPRGTLPSTTPRETIAPAAPVVMMAENVATWVRPLCVIDAPLDVPASLHAPPLYDLFQSYRI